MDSNWIEFELNLFVHKKCNNTIKSDSGSSKWNSIMSSIVIKISLSTHVHIVYVSK